MKDRVSFKKLIVILMTLFFTLTLCSAFTFVGGQKKGTSAETAEPVEASTNGDPSVDYSLNPLPLYVYEPLTNKYGSTGKTGLTEVNRSVWPEDMESKIHKLVVYGGEKSANLYGNFWVGTTQYTSANYRSPLDGKQLSGKFQTYLAALPQHTGRYYFMAPVEYNKIFTVCYTYSLMGVVPFSYVIRFTYERNGYGYVCDFHDPADLVKVLPSQYVPDKTWFENVKPSGDKLTVNDLLTPEQQQYLTAEITDNNDGTYTVVVNPTGSYTWDGGITAESFAAKSFTVSTSAPTVHKPQEGEDFTVTTDAVYTGEAIQGLTFTDGIDPDDYIIETDGKAGLSATGTGEHTTTIRPAEGKSWDDAEGDSDPVTVTWTVAKAEQAVTMGEHEDTIASGETQLTVPLSVSNEALFNSTAAPQISVPQDAPFEVKLGEDHQLIVTRKDDGAGLSGGTAKVTVTIPGDDNLEAKTLTFDVTVEADPGFYIEGHDDTTYPSLEAAVKALEKLAQGEGTPAIVVRGEVTVEEPIKLEAGTKFALKGEEGGNSKLTVATKAPLFDLAAGSVELGEGLTVSGTEGASLAHIKGGSFIVNGSIIQNFSISSMCVEKGILSIKKGTFVENRAQCGGAIFIKDGEINIDYGEFIGNTAEKNGGAIYAEGGKISIEESYFFGNTAKENGGGFYIRNCTTELITGALTYNKANNDGGAVYIAEYGAFRMWGGFIENNKSQNGGGIFVSDSSKVSLSDMCIQQNTAVGDGGGVFIAAKGTIHLYQGVLIMDNKGNIDNGSCLNNLFLSAEGRVKIEGDLFNSVIGISVKWETDQFLITNDKGPYVAFPMEYFQPDNSEYSINCSDEGLVLYQ